MGNPPSEGLGGRRIQPHSGDGRGIRDYRQYRPEAAGGGSPFHPECGHFRLHRPPARGKDTASFSTEDASGSTSQAAGVIEGLEAGSRVFLMDEDTCATNFMVRDELMQKVIHPDKEPITPFINRILDLWENRKVSTILVSGSSGSYFHVAHLILQADHYKILDITGNREKDGGRVSL